MPDQLRRLKLWEGARTCGIFENGQREHHTYSTEEVPRRKAGYPGPGLTDLTIAGNVNWLPSRSVGQSCMGRRRSTHLPPPSGP